MSKVLVISPHPDDMELAIGGSVKKFTSSGDTVDLAVVTGNGDLTMVHSGKTIPFDQRMLEQREAANVLGVKNIHWLDFAPASKFDTQPMSTLVSKLDNLLKNYDRVFIPLPSYNVDHKIVWEACLAATRPGKVDRLSIYAYEQPMQGHGEQVVGPYAFGRLYIEINASQIDAKHEALQCHKSQMLGRENTLTGTSGWRCLAAFRGVECSAKSYYAEMIYLVRAVL